MAAVAPATHTDLLKTLTSAPHAFLQPPTALYASSLSLLKETLDPIAASIADTQQQRLQDARKKRKRGQDHDDDQVLRLKKVHVNGFAIDQVWEQARRVIEAARQEAERGLEAVAFAQEIDSEEDDEEHGSSDIGEEGVDWEYDGEDVDGEDDDDHVDVNMDDAEEDDGLEEDDEDLDLDSDDADDHAQDEPPQEYVPDPNGLNDGFFSIDDFNRQSEFLEQADARGANDGDASDEEDVDWDTNPLGTGAGAAKPVGEDDDEEDGDGPTFGNVDLNAPEGFSDDDEEEIEEGEMDDLAAMTNTNNIKYAEFFAPPAQKARKNKKGRPNPHNFPAKQEKAPKDDEEEEQDIERTMSAVHRDLFEESDEEEAEQPEEALDPADPRSRRSTHERRRAALQEEIRRLEAANVAKREWTLSGEARAADRPLNSLLEEDLEFERAGKPVPVITAEISESIEELIKRRILAQDFNDILRRRPDDLATGKSERRGVARQDFELADPKNKQSLSDMYEQEHLKRTDANYVSATDEKAAKEHVAIDALWRDISGKLDMLSSLHFKPAQPALQVDVRVDAPVVRLEDARPTLGAEAAGASQLAPQEIYKAGEAVNRGEEVTTRGGGVVGRDEMGREERKRRRRREKEREKKASGNESGGGAKKTESKGAKERREVVADLKKGGVKVIGRKGELTNVEGEAVRGGDGGVVKGGSYKL